MAGIRSLLRPSRLIRRKAMYSGLLGSSRFWKVVAIGVFGKSTLQRFFGKNTETLMKRSLGGGRNVVVETRKPLTRKERKRLKRSGELLTPAEERAIAQLWADEELAKRQAASSSRRFGLFKR